MSTQTPKMASCILLNRRKLQNTRSDVTGNAIRVRVAFQHVMVAYDYSGSYHSNDAKLPLPRLGIPVVMVSHQRGRQIKKVEGRLRKGRVRGEVMRGEGRGRGKKR